MNPLVRTGVRLLPVVVVAILAYLWTVRPPASVTLPTQASPAHRWIKLLQSSYVEKRREAAEALAALGADARPAAPYLVTALRDKDVKVQRSAANAIRGIGSPAAPALIVALVHENRGLRFAAARLLSEVEPTNSAGVGVLIDGLKAPSQQVEARAALVRIGTPAVPALIATIQDPNPMLRRDAADILRDMGPKAAAAVAALAAALQDEEPAVRLTAARALAQVGPAAKDAVPALLACSTDTDPKLRQEVAEALAKLGPAAVPALTASLKHDDKARRASAARALAQLGAQAKPAAAALRESLTDDDPAVRREAARALAPLGTDDTVVAILADALRVGDFRDKALASLLQCGTAGRAVLVAALKDRDEEVRAETARALGRMGLAAKDAIPALIETLKDPDRAVRREAAHALGWIPADMQLSVPALVMILKDPWSVNRAEAAIALSRLGPAAKAAVPALLANLMDDEVDVIQEARKALVEIGPAAVPALRDALNSKDAEVARTAAELLKQIEAKTAAGKVEE